MASLTTLVNFHSKLHSSHSLSLSSNFLHFHFRLHSLPPRSSPLRVSHAIPNPKFNLNLQNYRKNDGDYEYDDDELNGRRTWKRRKRSNRRSKQRPWWSVQFEEDDEDVDEDERKIFDEVVDSLLVIKVFRSYGWFSPIIIISLLATSGPKAFLVAVSIFFGLSLLIFAFQKLQERLVSSSKPQNRRKRRSKYGQRNNTFMEEEVDQDGQLGKRNKRRDYQSGAARNNGSFYTSQNGNGVGGNNFGGWDELVKDDETQRVRKPSRENGRPKMMEEEEERLSRSMQDRDLPLLLRLLVAVFPFLASWTNLL